MVVMYHEGEAVMGSCASSFMCKKLFCHIYVKNTYGYDG